LRKKVAKVHARLQELLGRPEWDGPEDPLEGLIHTILSQNTSDVNSGRAWQNLRKVFPRMEMLLDAPAPKIARAIRCGGLANQKSRRIKDFLKWVNETYGKLSLDCLCDMSPGEAVETLSQHRGIGIKTIYVTLMFACGKDVFPVDTHIERIVKRLALVPPKASLDTTTHLMQPLVPEGESLPLHINLIRFGRSICKSQNPHCWRCPFVRMCSYEKKNLTPPGRPPH
jgi:endonuclease-3